MSKISEQKALEEYPEIEGTETYFDRDCICTKPIDLNRQKRIGYIKGYDQGVADEREKLMAEMSDIDIYHQGYDQAFEDFLEKAERWLEPTFKSIAGYNCGGDLMNDFKNYMQDE